MTRSVIHSSVEALLGRRLDSAERGRISDLNAVSPDLVRELRELPFVERSWYLRYCVDETLHRHLQSFGEAVVVEGKDPAGWLRGAVLVPLLPIDRLLGSPVADIVAPLTAPDRSVSQRMVLNVTRYQQGDEFVGAPALPRGDIDYRWSAPDGVTRLEAGCELVAIADVPLAVRRWMASRLAWFARARGSYDSSLGPEALVERVLGKPLEISSDARIALNGLAAEHRTLGPSDREVPGFRGEDAWYRG
ncbi:MAG: hypothetical protein HYY17_11890 [Planctomycetes bacterium]|nr:hypothetical protein [Planctomycetota bacterium]